MFKLFQYLVFISLFAFWGCTKTVETQMQEYLEFYYPTTGTNNYQIVFDWGNYIIDTGASADEELHPDSKIYRGYITARTNNRQTPDGEKLKTYLVTPKGDVWTTEATDIPETKARQEVTEEKTDQGTTTTTTTINSSSEPVIDYFLAHKEAWKKYGILKSSDGKKYKLDLVSSN